MPTTYYLTSTASDGAITDALDTRALATARGAGAVSSVTNTATGPVTPPTTATQVTGTAGGNRLGWLSPPINAVTISGTITVDLWGFESATQANATLVAEVLRCNAAGTVLSVVAAVGTAGAELGTTSAERTYNKTPTSTAFSTGDRIGVRVYIDDGSGVTMASGRTVTFRYNGASVNADGESLVTFTETITAAPITGSAAVTLGALTSSGAGALAIAGTSALTLGALTASGAGTVADASISGSAALTLGALTSSGAGALSIAGTSTLTLGALTASGVGASTIAGTATLTLGALTSTGAGALPIEGSASLALGALTMASAGTLPIAGSASLTLGALTATGAGASTIEGAASLTLGALTSTGAGSVGNVGTGEAALTLGALTVSAQGSSTIEGAGALTLGALTSSGAGVLTLSGSASVTLGALTLTAAGTYSGGEVLSEAPPMRTYHAPGLSRSTSRRGSSRSARFGSHDRTTELPDSN